MARIRDMWAGREEQMSIKKHDEPRASAKYGVRENIVGEKRLQPVSKSNEWRCNPRGDLAIGGRPPINPLRFRRSATSANEFPFLAIPASPHFLGYLTPIFILMQFGRAKNVKSSLADTTPYIICCIVPEDPSFLTPPRHKGVYSCLLG